MNRYKEIFQELEDKIKTGEFASGEKLPSENKLAQEYSVSRETIRKALVLLAEQGYIQKQQGKGSIILDIPTYDFPVSGLTSYHELTKTQHLPSITKVPVFHKGRICNEKEHHRLFPFNETTELYTIIRQRELSGEVVIIDKDYLDAEIIPDLTKDHASTSLYQYIEDSLKLEIGYAKKEITVEPITNEDQELMSLRPTDSCVVVVRSQVFLQDTRLFQYTESRHRIDKFKFVEFARRNKK